MNKHPSYSEEEIQQAYRFITSTLPADAEAAYRALVARDPRIALLVTDLHLARCVHIDLMVEQGMQTFKERVTEEALHELYSNVPPNKPARSLHRQLVYVLSAAVVLLLLLFFVDVRSTRVDQTAALGSASLDPEYIKWSTRLEDKGTTLDQLLEQVSIVRTVYLQDPDAQHRFDSVVDALNDLRRERFILSGRLLVAFAGDDLEKRRQVLDELQRFTGADNMISDLAPRLLSSIVDTVDQQRRLIADLRSGDASSQDRMRAYAERISRLMRERDLMLAERPSSVESPAYKAMSDSISQLTTMLAAQQMELVGLQGKYDKLNKITILGELLPTIKEPFIRIGRRADSGHTRASKIIEWNAYFVFTRGDPEDVSEESFNIDYSFPAGWLTDKIERTRLGKPGRRIEDERIESQGVDFVPGVYSVTFSSKNEKGAPFTAPFVAE